MLANGQRVEATGFEKTGAPEARGPIVANLPRRDTTVSLIAHSGGLVSAPVSLRFTYDGASPAELLKPKLYALLVGVTGYENPDFDNVHYSAHDADDLAAALMSQKGGLYADVQVTVVNNPNRPDSNPTRDNAVNGLYWLQHVVTNRDLAVIFLGGHGYLDAKQNFWFLTCEADLTRLRTTAISNDDLLDLIGSIPGKKVLFIDAGHAGLRSATGRASTNPDMDKVINDLSAAGSDLVAFAASTGTEFASENEKWNRHSAFAEALIEAIGEGKASFEPSGRITIDMLQVYIEDRVKEMTEGRQHPVMNRSSTLPDFPLALAH